MSHSRCARCVGVTQSVAMVLAAGSLRCGCSGRHRQAPSQRPGANPPSATIETFTRFTRNPPALSRPNRLRLLRRERERKSLRWEQFELLIKGGAPMPEPAFAYALYYRIADDEHAGRKAVAWALNPANTGCPATRPGVRLVPGSAEPSGKPRMATRLEKAAKAPGSLCRSAALPRAGRYRPGGPFAGAFPPQCFKSLYGIGLGAAHRSLAGRPESDSSRSRLSRSSKFSTPSATI